MSIQGNPERKNWQASVHYDDEKDFFSAGGGVISWEDSEADFSADPLDVFFRGGVACRRRG